MICYFSSKTGNTERFVKSLDNSLPLYNIQKKGDVFVAKHNFVLFVATYCNGEGKNAIPKQVIEFIKRNHTKMVGVVSSGNRNFGKYYAISGDIVSRNCGVPLLHKYELFGTETDKEKINDILKKINF